MGLPDSAGPADGRQLEIALSALATSSRPGGELRFHGAQGLFHRHSDRMVAAGGVDVRSGHPEIDAGLEAWTRLVLVVEADDRLFNPMGAGQRAQPALDQSGHGVGAGDLSMMKDKVHAPTVAVESDFE